MRKSFPWPSGLASRFSCLLNSFGGSRKPGLPVGQSWLVAATAIPFLLLGIVENRTDRILLEAKSAFLSMTSPMSVPKTGAAGSPSKPATGRKTARSRPKIMNNSTRQFGFRRILSGGSDGLTLAPAYRILRFRDAHGEWTVE